MAGTMTIMHVPLSISSILTGQVPSSDKWNVRASACLRLDISNVVSTRRSHGIQCLRAVNQGKYLPDRLDAPLHVVDPTGSINVTMSTVSTQSTWKGRVTGLRLNRAPHLTNYEISIDIATYDGGLHSEDLDGRRSVFFGIPCFAAFTLLKVRGNTTHLNDLHNHPPFIFPFKTLIRYMGSYFAWWSRAASRLDPVKEHEQEGLGGSSTP